ncbi:hypothetical protein HF329_33235 [Chitinophaga oryzae]|uniref:Transposase n=1 Tax=Chitinophaga oryzae TaxID=2725414 RepID=A0AAE7DBS5_9BACT|nr:hypothetical protein [Chitinophaga oryzae]QJB35914.1 hypothetical protein HF329_33235 [Chitinophaga oryzae]
MRRKHKKAATGKNSGVIAPTAQANIAWSMDFMHDTLSKGVTFRSFNIIDDYNRVDV